MYCVHANSLHRWTPDSNALWSVVPQKVHNIFIQSNSERLAFVHIGAFAYNLLFAKEVVLARPCFEGTPSMYL